MFHIPILNFVKKNIFTNNSSELLKISLIPMFQNWLKNVRKNILMFFSKKLLYAK